MEVSLSVKATLLLLTLGVILPIRADVFTLSFSCISAPNQCGTAASGLFIDVVGNTSTHPFGSLPIAIGNNQALFIVRNTLPTSASVHEVFFDDASLLGIASLFETAGVNYKTATSKPKNLPGGKTLTPSFDSSITVDIDGRNGLGVDDPAELLGILFDLQSGKTYGDVLAALNLGGAAGGLRLGLHVGNANGNESASFVNAIPGGNGGPGGNAVPEPGSLVLLATVAAGTCVLMRKQLFP